LLADQLRLQLDFGRALSCTQAEIPELPPLQKTVPYAQQASTIAEAPCLPGYRVLGMLGSGGMGIVYAGEQLNPPRPVALKLIHRAGQPTSQELARFRAETEAIARVNHPNIVQIYEVGECDGRPFFSLEFVNGVNLAQHAQRTALQPLQVAALIEILARA